MKQITKKIVTIVLAFVLVIYFSACSPTKKKITGTWRMHNPDRTTVIIFAENGRFNEKTSWEVGGIYTSNTSWSGSWKISGDRIVLSSDTTSLKETLIYDKGTLHEEGDSWFYRKQ